MALHTQELRNVERKRGFFLLNQQHVQYLYNVLIMNCADGKLKIRDLETTIAEQASTITRLARELEDKDSALKSATAKPFCPLDY